MGCSFHKVHCQQSAIVKTVTLASRSTRCMHGSALEEGRSEESCLKIRIYDDCDLSWDSLDCKVSMVAESMRKNTQDIYKRCNEFLSFLAYFEILVHGVCIDEFNFRKGFEMIFVYAKLNEIKVSLRKQKFFVFFQESDQKLEVLQVWNRIGEFIQVFLQKKELEHQEQEIKDYLGERVFLSFTKSSHNLFEILNEYLKLYKTTIAKSVQISSTVSEYVHNFKANMKIIDQKIQRYKLANGLTFIEISHALPL